MHKVVNWLVCFGVLYCFCSRSNMEAVSCITVPWDVFNREVFSRSCIEHCDCLMFPQVVDFNYLAFVWHDTDFSQVEREVVVVEFSPVDDHGDDIAVSNSGRIDRRST